MGGPEGHCFAATGATHHPCGVRDAETCRIHRLIPPGAGARQPRVKRLIKSGAPTQACPVMELIQKSDALAPASPVTETQTRHRAAGAELEFGARGGGV